MDNYHKTGDQKIPTRMFCQICGHLHKIDFWVPDEIWNEAIHPRWRDTHVCLNCFMERADERLLEWEKDIILIPCSMATQLKVQQGEEVPDGISAINEVNGLRKKVEELELIIYGIEEGAAKWESLCADKDKEIAELKKEIDNLISPEYSSPSEKAVLKTQITDLKAEIERINEKWGILSAQNDMFELENDKLKAEIKRLKGENFKLSKTLKF